MATGGAESSAPVPGIARGRGGRDHAARGPRRDNAVDMRTVEAAAAREPAPGPVDRVPEFPFGLYMASIFVGAGFGAEAWAKAPYNRRGPPAQTARA